MSAAIQQAAISYFGLPEGTQMVEGGPLGCFAFVIPLTEEHMRGIADRMKALEVSNAFQAGSYKVPDTQIFRSKEDLRIEYNSMSPDEKARFGSFGQYCAQSAMGMAQEDAIEPEAQGEGGRKVMHVNAPDEDIDLMPQAVWFPTQQLDRNQLMLVSDARKDGHESLIQWIMLTEDQRNKYVGRE